MTTPPRRRGPKPRPDAKLGAIRVRLTAQERADLDRIARDNQQSLTEFIREAISEAVADCTDERVLSLT